MCILLKEISAWGYHFRKTGLLQFKLVIRLLPIKKKKIITELKLPKMLNMNKKPPLKWSNDDFFQIFSKFIYNSIIKEKNLLINQFIPIFFLNDRYCSLLSALNLAKLYLLDTLIIKFFARKVPSRFVIKRQESGIPF